MPHLPDMSKSVDALDAPKYWSVRRGVIQLSSLSVVTPGDEPYEVRCWSLCGRDEATTMCVPAQGQKPMPVREFVRRCRIVATIQHYLQNGCGACFDMLKNATTSEERRWIYCSDPRLGKVLGFEEKTGQF